MDGCVLDGCVLPVCVVDGWMDGWMDGCGLCLLLAACELVNGWMDVYVGCMWM
jgi:hypothetical protein